MLFFLGIHKLKSSLPPRDPKSVRSQPFDPIPPVAKQISSKWWLLCFDEFQVICSNMYPFQIALCSSRAKSLGLRGCCLRKTSRSHLGSQIANFIIMIITMLLSLNETHSPGHQTWFNLCKLVLSLWIWLRFTEI